MSVTQKPVMYPTREDVAMAEIAVFEQQLHAIVSTFMHKTYPEPTKHDMGVMLIHAQMIAHDLEYNCGQLATQYADAVAAEEEAARDQHSTENS